MRSSFLHTILILVAFCLSSFAMVGNALAQDVEFTKLENQSTSTNATDNSAPVVYDTNNNISIELLGLAFQVGELHDTYRSEYELRFGLEYLRKINDIWSTGAYLSYGLQISIGGGQESIFAYFMNEFAAVKRNKFTLAPRVGIGYKRLHEMYDLYEVGLGDYYYDNVSIYAGLKFDWRLNRVFSLGFIIDCQFDIVAHAVNGGGEDDERYTKGSFMFTPEFLFNLSFHF